MTIPIAVEAPPFRALDDGTIRIGGTRVTLDTILHAYNRGASAEDIIRMFPTLSLADVYLTIGYYLRHKDEVDAYLKKREEEANQLRQKIETEFNQVGIRARLLARRQKKDE